MARRKKRKSFPDGARSAPIVKERDKPGKSPDKVNKGQPFRETVESLVVAFVLAFLFRTFQAEAFVIPTGSMAPTLMGRHKDVYCEQSGERYKVNASTEAGSLAQLQAQGYGGRSNDPQRMRYDAQTVGGVSPSCRYPMAYAANVKGGPVDLTSSPAEQPAFSGDRILVNKYLYEFTDPKRWDVVVFKYPGDANTNYIKRLVGLPNEELRVLHGDVFTRPAGSDAEFTIAAKSPDKVMAMRQLVHDTDRDAALLHEAGWPLRWKSDGGWEVTAKRDDKALPQTYSSDPSSDEMSWLRYQHTPALPVDWYTATRNPEAIKIGVQGVPLSWLVTDYNAYNTAITRRQANKDGGLGTTPDNLGLHWVGDLMVEADVEADDAGELVLDLVEGGQHFTCTIDLATGDATLGIEQFESREPIAGYAPVATGVAKGGGRRRLRFANVDDRLLLWVDGSVVEFDRDTAYDVDVVFGGRGEVLPQTSRADGGDLAPVGVGTRGAKVAVSRLQVWRDLYYIADSWRNPLRRNGMPGLPVSDFKVNRRLLVDSDNGPVPLPELCRAANAANWSAFRQRRAEDFTTGDDQFFVMGDNSAASSDARLWAGGNGGLGGVPGGPYLERPLLIGKAVCVYWPHSWVFPLPNITDMRLVR